MPGCQVVLSDELAVVVVPVEDELAEAELLEDELSLDDEAVSDGGGPGGGGGSGPTSTSVGLLLSDELALLELLEPLSLAELLPID